MKIAIAQLNYTIGDVDGNASKIIDSIHKAKAQHADLVIFAEQAVSGTPAFDLLRKTTFLELCEEALEKIASRCDGITALVGLPVLTREGTISAAALLENGRIQRYIGKKYISARREMGFLVPSKGYEYITVKGHKCAVVVGDDLSRERDFDKSVETIISINARRYGKGTMTYRYEMMRDLAFVEGKNLVMANQVGGSTEIVYDGTSGAMNSRGEVVVMMKSFEEDFQIFDTKAEAAPIAVSSSYNERTRLIYEAARCGVRDFFRKNGYAKASIGLSGGIDSSVTAVMAVDAFGAKNVHGVLLPGPYSTGHSIDDALTLAENLGIESHTVSICEPFEAFEQVIRKSYKEKLEGLASENTQARCRMVILMALSNANRWMLVNTGNKSEAAMGYSTLYGDTAGAFAPLGGLYKTDVYEVGRWRNEQARAAGDVEPIPENVFVKPPSAELAPGQKDEASMGIDYETLDKLLIAVQEQGQSVEDACDALGFDIMQATGLLARVDSYAFKRAQEPPFPDVKFYG